MSKTYRIYPSIGIARIGKSDEMFIGPESPYMPVKGPFKKKGLIKKQGARFRIYEFEVDEFGREKITQELTSSSSVTINWHVHLCNRKAASRIIPKEPAVGTAPKRNPEFVQERLVIEGKQSISGEKNRSDDIVGKIQFIREASGLLESEDDVVLGRLETDEEGRLIVVGGNGVSRSPLGKAIIHFANNPGWYDDCCDGPVGATITIDGHSVEAEKAWVVVASPAYAPEIDNVVTWLDQAKNVEAMFFNPRLGLESPSFTDDIYPILKRLSLLQWVIEDARVVHATGQSGYFIAPDVLKALSDNSETTKSKRQRIFNRLMEPHTEASAAELLPTSHKNMPKLYSGVNPVDRNKYEYASLTPFQYLMMKKWAEGDFSADWKGEPAEKAFEDLPLKEQPDALTRAALEDCIGGPFFPGIETTYIMALAESYQSPYRINQALQAGHMTELMAVPWQADFLDCGKFWWPAQRPVSVRTSKTTKKFEAYSRGIDDYSDMLEHWNELGFLVKDGDAYIEAERGQI